MYLDDICVILPEDFAGFESISVERADAEVAGSWRPNIHTDFAYIFQGILGIVLFISLIIFLNRR